MNFKNEKVIKGKEQEMSELGQNLTVLKTFKDTKTVREDMIKQEQKRYEALKRELEVLKRNGKEEMESMKTRLKQQ